MQQASTAAIGSPVTPCLGVPLDAGLMDVRMDSRSNSTVHCMGLIHFVEVLILIPLLHLHSFQIGFENNKCLMKDL